MDYIEKQNKMEWIKIDKDNLPEQLVLAANFSKDRLFGYKEKILGYLAISKKKDMFFCENNMELLENCTHYISINDFDVELIR